MDQGSTGNFEIKVDGVLIHSKKTHVPEFAGKATTKVEIEAIVAKIVEALKAKNVAIPPRDVAAFEARSAPSGGCNIL
jgi:hypothetical protein